MVSHINLLVRLYICRSTLKPQLYGYNVGSQLQICSDSKLGTSRQIHSQNLGAGTQRPQPFFPYYFYAITLWYSTVLFIIHDNTSYISLFQYPILSFIFFSAIFVNVPRYLFIAFVIFWSWWTFMYLLWLPLSN